MAGLAMNCPKGEERRGPAGREPRFPEYGDGGDQIGARRGRRAFRWAVLFCVTFTAMLWIAERQLRYDHAERLYLSALALPRESARVMLRQAVLHDENVRESPTPKYLQALAEREEDEMVLPAYKRAYELDPGNAALAVSYGCRLFHEGKVEEARSRFREAAGNAPDNALPAYLEAAVLPWIDPEKTDLGDSLAIIARTNSSSAKPVTYPRPLWASDLPQDGRRYAELSRELVRNCSEPLYRFTDLFVRTAQEAVNRRRLQYWDSWLVHLQTMGERIAAGAVAPADSGSPTVPGSAPQAHVGLYIQFKALELREQIARIRSGKADEELMKRRLAIEGAIEEVRSFEEDWDARLDPVRKAYHLPLVLGAKAIALFVALYLSAFALGKLMRVGTTGRTVAQTLTGKIALLSGPGLLLLILGVCGLLQRFALMNPGWLRGLTAAWWAVVTPYAALGTVTPLLALPPVHEVCRRFSHRDDFDGILRHAKRLKRSAYVTLMRRYYGVAAGTTIGAICLWAVGFRVLVSLYPWQVGLLTTGLSGEEAELVTHILAQLAGHGL